MDEDSDDDGLSDGDEVLETGTDPNDPDSDADGLSDGDEIEVYGTDPLEADTDEGGISDGIEVLDYGTDPLDASDDVLPIDSTDDTDKLADCGCASHQRPAGLLWLAVILGWLGWRSRRD